MRHWLSKRDRRLSLFQPAANLRWHFSHFAVFWGFQGGNKNLWVVDASSSFHPPTPPHPPPTSPTFASPLACLSRVNFSQYPPNGDFARRLCFYLLISHFDKLSTWISRLPFSLHRMLNLSIDFLVGIKAFKISVSIENLVFTKNVYYNSKIQRQIFPGIQQHNLRAL